MFEINKFQQVGHSISYFDMYPVHYSIYRFYRKQENNDSVQEAMYCAQSMVRIEIYSTINELESAHRGYFITKKCLISLCLMKGFPRDYWNGCRNQERPVQL